MKLQDLNKIIYSNLVSSNIIRSNLSNTLIITESKNVGISGKLQTLTINNMPVNNCWLFEHENSEIEFRTVKRKVEKSIIYLAEEDKELLIILIEMKSGFGIKELFQCQEKLNDSLSHLSIFLASNNHTISKYDGYKIKFRFPIFCNNYNIANTHPRFNDPLPQSFIKYSQGNTKTFKMEINSPSLGFNLIPTVTKLEQSQENISIDFEDLLGLFS